MGRARRLILQRALWPIFEKNSLVRAQFFGSLVHKNKLLHDDDDVVVLARWPVSVSVLIVSVKLVQP